MRAKDTLDVLVIPVTLDTVLLIVLAATADAAGPGPPVKPREVHALLAQAIAAEAPAEYARHRDRIVGLGQAGIPHLRRIARHGQTWQERSMAEICLERIQHPKEVKAFLSRDPGLVDHRLGPFRLRLCAGYFWQWGQRTPMTLVERLWRFNEFPDGVGSSREEKGYLGLALGEMGEVRAREAIEAALKASKWLGGSSVAMKGMVIGLAKLGAAESVPTLLQVTEDCYGEGGFHGVGKVALLALTMGIREMPAERRPAFVAESKGKVKKQAVQEALADLDESLPRTRRKLGGFGSPFDFRLDAASIAEFMRPPRPLRDAIHDYVARMERQTDSRCRILMLEAFLRTRRRWRTEEMASGDWRLLANVLDRALKEDYATVCPRIDLPDVVRRALPDLLPQAPPEVRPALETLLQAYAKEHPD